MNVQNIIDLANARRARADEERARRNDDLIAPLRKRIADLEEEREAAKPAKRERRGR